MVPIIIYAILLFTIPFVILTYNFYELSKFLIVCNNSTLLVLSVVSLVFILPLFISIDRNNRNELSINVNFFIYHNMEKNICLVFCSGFFGYICGKFLEYHNLTDNYINFVWLAFINCIIVILLSIIPIIIAQLVSQITMFLNI